MFNQQRGIFKPSLKSHTIPSTLYSKRFSFNSQNINETEENKNRSRINEQESLYPDILYPNLQQSQFMKVNKGEKRFAMNEYGYGRFNKKQQDQYLEQPQTQSIPITKFDPIVPKVIFKQFLQPQHTVSLHENGKHIPVKVHNNNKILQELRVKNISYPKQVEKMFKQTQQNKKIFNDQMEKQNPNFNQNNSQKMEAQLSSQQYWEQNSYKQSLKRSLLQTRIKKIPYFPLMGTDGSIFWCHSFDKIILWKYHQNDFQHPQVFCILSFKKQIAPISALYVTQIKSQIFKKQRTVLISIAFVNTMQFFIFDIIKYQKQLMINIRQNQRTEQYYRKYVQRLLIKVNAKFIIQKIIVQNVPNYQSATKHVRPLIIFTDGGKDLQIVDLENTNAYKTLAKYDLFSSWKRNKYNKGQHQIIKILHCIDDKNPFLHYCFVLRKQTMKKITKAKGFFELIKGLFQKKKQEFTEEMIISIYQWNQTELKNDTLYKKYFNPQRLNKIKQLTSIQLQNRIKQNYFDFYRMNINNEFIIADMSLIQKMDESKILSKNRSKHHNLKISFTNGTSIHISNFKTLQFNGKIKINPYIQKSISIISSQLSSYYRLLDKHKYFLSAQQIKNKYNMYIYESYNEYFKQKQKYSLIDPIISQCNGLNICQNKIIYQNSQQVLFKFLQNDQRKRIYEVNTVQNRQVQKIYKISLKQEFNKRFIIFQNLHMTMIEIPNLAQNFLVLAYLKFKYPQEEYKIREQIKRFFEQADEENRITILEAIINLLIDIQKSGKDYSKETKQKEWFKNYHFNQQNKQIDQTTYLQDNNDNNYFNNNNNKKQAQTFTFAYRKQLDKKSFVNLVQNLLGPQIRKKQEHILQSHNISYNGKSFQLSITQKFYNYLFEILLLYGTKQTPQDKSNRPIKFLQYEQLKNSSFYKNLSSWLDEQNETNKNYLIHLFSNMAEINQSLLSYSISKYIVYRISPLFQAPYSQFRQKKMLLIQTIQKLQDLSIFINKLIIKFTQKGNIQNKYYQKTQKKLQEENLLYYKTIQNSIPKIILILRLFDNLSEIEYIKFFKMYQLKNKNRQKTKQLSINANKSNITKQINLKNLLFNIETRFQLQKLTVEYLFEQNSIMLDQIEQKLPELSHVKKLRFFIGWRKINSKIIEQFNNGGYLNSSGNKQRSQGNINNNKGSKTWIFQWFNSNDTTSKKSDSSRCFPKQSEYQETKQIQQKKKQQYFEIQKSLSQYSFQQYKKYFLMKKQYCQFVQIILNKISYLQSLYLEYMNKYKYNEVENSLINNPNNWKRWVSGNKRSNNQFSDGLIEENIMNDGGKRRMSKDEEKFKSFLEYEEMVYNHQKYLKIEGQILYLNQQLYFFVQQLLRNYLTKKANQQKFLLNFNQMNSQFGSYQNNKSNKRPQQYSIQFEYQQYLNLSKSIQKILTLLSQKTSTYIKTQLIKLLQSNPIGYEVFLQIVRNLFNLPLPHNKQNIGQNLITNILEGINSKTINKQTQQNQEQIFYDLLDFSCHNYDRFLLKNNNGTSQSRIINQSDNRAINNKEEFYEKQKIRMNLQRLNQKESFNRQQRMVRQQGQQVIEPDRRYSNSNNWMRAVQKQSQIPFYPSRFG